MPILIKTDNTRGSIRSVNSLEQASAIIDGDAEEYKDYNGDLIAYIDSDSRYSDKPVNIPIMEYIARKMNRTKESLHLIRGDAIVVVRPVI